MIGLDAPCPRFARGRAWRKHSGTLAPTPTPLRFGDFVRAVRCDRTVNQTEIRYSCYFGAYGSPYSSGAVAFIPFAKLVA
jgi:hypothetical protein